MQLQARITMVTLGVRDLKREVEFYRDGLGWPLSSASNDQVAFFRTGSTVLGLFGWDALAADATVDAQGDGFRGTALVYNVHQRSEVAQVLEHVASVGGQIVKPAEDVFWGGHSGYFFWAASG